VLIISFGYLHGPPPEAHITIDLRDLFRDPHVDPAMREMTGLDKAVIDNVLVQPGAVAFVGNLISMVTSLETWCSPFTVAFGCVGGRHRSVVFANQLRQYVMVYGRGHAVVEHRDIDKPVVYREATP
jgi:RNase adaptor protein for sRNA GlmZ degradation